MKTEKTKHVSAFHHQNTNGATLIELAVVLVILSIIMALAAVGSEFAGEERVGGASKELLGDLQRIRQTAMTHGPDTDAPQLRGFGVRFESARRYLLFRFNDSNLNSIYDGAAEETPLNSGELAPLRRDVSGPLALAIKRNTGLVAPDNDVLIFDGFGIPRRSNMGFQKISVVIQTANMNAVEKKCVSVSLSRIREGLWDGRECKEQ
jgi:prepilin-type N-terminal cleavage/methylation domain-containing protein